MRIFASELSRCRVFKAIFGWVAVFFGFVLFIVVPIMWILQAPIEKTERDFVKEYLYERFNFTPDTVDKAYHSPYQYVFPLYEETIKEEIKYVKNERVYQVFRLADLRKINGKFYAKGRLARMRCKGQCSLIFDGYVKVRVAQPKRYKFVVEEVK